ICNLFSLRCAYSSMGSYFMYINKRGAILLLIGAILTSSLITIRPIQGETGKGDDIFKVILTVFGADKSKGDIVAIVTINNGEASRVKFLDTDKVLATTSSNPSTLPASTTNLAAGEGIIEYVATFPNVTVNAGDEYKVCALPVKTLELICTTGNNSPAHRPEFVDLSLNMTSEVEQALRQGGSSNNDRSDED
ncbi:MAG TPA: hypothetical protein VFS97_06935, partial [Nitrososphaeraceae archaeon]|nr:hypothetical protein [Nitrososphaeraceae archaeon]